MLDWIIGGIIAIATVAIIVRAILNKKKGKSGCACSGCDMAKNNCTRAK